MKGIVGQQVPKYKRKGAKMLGWKKYKQNLEKLKQGKLKKQNGAHN